MMQLLWILGPPAQYALLALTLTACLALSLSMKREVDAMRRSNREAAAAYAATRAAEPASLRREGEGEGNETPFVVGQDLNLTRRAQAIRMQRRGESAATITAALRVPRNEIDLLLKIQKLADNHEQGTLGPLAATSGDQLDLVGPVTS
jgi:hypothetical protein